VVTNHSRRTRQLEFTSYLELALSLPGADAAHPAFNKLFIETEYPEEGVLLAHRRKRSPDEPTVWCAHVVTGAPGSIQFETDRRAFLGRSRTPRSPKAMETDLGDSVGCVLDPIFSLRCSGSVPSRGRMELAFVTLAADSRDGALALAAKYKRREAVARAFEMAWTHAQLEDLANDLRISIRTRTAEQQRLGGRLTFLRAVQQQQTPDFLLRHELFGETLGMQSIVQRNRHTRSSRLQNAKPLIFEKSPARLRQTKSIGPRARSIGYTKPKLLPALPAQPTEVCCELRYHRRLDDLKEWL